MWPLLFFFQGIGGGLLEPDTGVWVEEALERSDMGLKLIEGRSHRACVNACGGCSPRALILWV